MVTRTLVSNEPARSLFYNILSHRFAGIFRENIFPVRKKERRGEWNLEKKTGIRIGNLVVSPSRSSFVSSFLVVFNFLSLLRSISLSSTHETNSAQGVFKSGNVRLSRCATFEIEHNGATLSLSLSISSFSRGRHRYKTAFASLSNSRSYSPFSLPLSSPSYILRHLSPSFVSTPHAYVYTSSSIVIQFTEVESPPARRVD